jgi:hypothetical protein
MQRSGERVDFTRGVVTRDSVTGTRLAGGADPGARLALPRDSVQFVEERRLSWGRTIGLSLGIYMGAGLAYALSAW